MPSKRATAALLLLACVLAAGCTRKLRQENEALWAENEKLQKALDQARKEQDTLRQSVAARDADMAALPDLQQKLKDAEKQVADLTSARDALEKELTASQTAAKDVKAELAKLKGALEGPGADVSLRGGLVTITLTDDVQFGFAKATLTDRSKSTLRRIARVLNDRYADALIRVDGHTDNVPIKKDASKDRWADNWGLGADRSLAVLRYLVSDCDIKPERVYATTFGEVRSLATNSTAEGRARNRRVEIVILPPKRAAP